MKMLRLLDPINRLHFNSDTKEQAALNYSKLQPSSKNGNSPIKITRYEKGQPVSVEYIKASKLKDKKVHTANVVKADKRQLWKEGRPLSQNDIDIIKKADLLN